MRAAFYERQGTAREVLTVGELPDPQPGAGEVRVRIVVSGINPSDIKTRVGFGGKAMPFPRIVPHQDGSGVIDSVGPSVSQERIGERVWVYMAQTGRAFGTAAEFVVVPSRQAVRLADNVPFGVGASFGVPAMTAHRCLFADTDLRGKRVLVQGGAGAVGNAAILLAKWAGAWVAATVSRDEQADVAGAAGADLVVNRHAGDVAVKIRSATDGHGVDRIVDVDISDNIDTAIACLARDRGRVGLLHGIAASQALDPVLSGARWWLFFPFRLRLYDAGNSDARCCRGSLGLRGFGSLRSQDRRNARA